MDLRRLKIFISVVNRSNLTKAAKDCGLSQPALTRCIQTLEDELGMQLLERLPRGMVPTESGKRLFIEAKYLISENERIERELRGIENGTYGTVRVGMAPMFATHIIDASIARVRKEAIGLNIQVIEGMHSELIAMLVDGKLDLIFMNYTHDVPQIGLKSEELCSVEAVVVASSNNSLARKKRLLASDIMNANWVLMSISPQSHAFAEYMLDNNYQPPKDFVTTNSLPLIRSLILNYGFVSMLPKRYLKDDVASGHIKTLPFRSGPLIRPAGLIYRIGSLERKSIANVAQVIREVCKTSSME